MVREPVDFKRRTTAVRRFLRRPTKGEIRPQAKSISGGKKVLVSFKRGAIYR